MINAEENQTSVTTVTAVDTDVPADKLTFTISGGLDAALFNLDPDSGVLTFKTAPVFAGPADANTDGFYEVMVEVADNGEPIGMDSQDIFVTVNMHVPDEGDYEAYAAAPGIFPQGATPQQKAFDYDYDGDGKTNGEEFAAGTDPNDPNDFFLGDLFRNRCGNSNSIWSLSSSLE